MRKYLKDKYNQDDPSSDHPKYWNLSFSAIETDFEEIALNVILIRSRVSELSVNFRNDALTAQKYFNVVTILAFLLGIGVCIWAVMVSFIFPPKSSALLPGIVVLVGAISGLAAAGASSFGLHKKYHAMFAAHWAMKAIRTNIDHTVYSLAMRSKKGVVSAESLDLLQKRLDEWLALYTKTLMSFGETYGSALTPISFADIKFASK